MSAPLRTPVVVVLFNRPERVRELLAVLRQVRPARVLAVADGPRSAHPDDAAACRDARAALAAIDWPCTVERCFADTNLGCDARVLSGLDWAFAQVPEAIVLEDDVLPHPSFFAWAESQLGRCRTDPGVLMISGHNPLGVWPIGDAGAAPPRVDALRVRRGSVWGWATTAAAWRTVRATDLGGAAAAAAADLARLRLDPLVAAHLLAGLEAHRRGRRVAWDVRVGIAVAMRGTAMTSPVNLVRNTGIGRGATRTAFEGDFSGRVPVGVAPMLPATRSTAAVDPAFDRAAVLVELLTRCADPSMAWRLARLPAATRLRLDADVQHHLAPFRVPAESQRLLEHLAALGVASPGFERLRATLAAAAAAAAATAATADAAASSGAGAAASHREGGSEASA